MKKRTAAALGIFAGLGGATHGPGEMLQGNVAPGNIFISAWPALTALDGEPAITLIPSYLVAGIATIIVGIIVAWWAAKCLDRPDGGPMLVLLSVALLLVGGGQIPPLFGIAAGLLWSSTARKESKRAEAVA